MGAKSGDLLVTELQRRITNLSATTALDALNRAIRWTMRQASFQFMLSAPAQLVVSAQIAPAQAATATSAIAFDAGKAKLILNTDGSPIQHLPMSEFWGSINYNVASTANYDVYTIATANAAGAPSHTFYFLPNISSVVLFQYHRQALDLVKSPSSYTELPSEFDDLLVDLAEAEERRVYDVGDSWQLLFARSTEQMKSLIDNYRSQTQQPSQVTDAQAKIAEETQIGRA